MCDDSHVEASKFEFIDFAHFFIRKLYTKRRQFSGPNMDRFVGKIEFLKTSILNTHHFHLIQLQIQRNFIFVRNNVIFACCLLQNMTIKSVCAHIFRPIDRCVVLPMRNSLHSEIRSAHYYYSFFYFFFS